MTEAIEYCMSCMTWGRFFGIYITGAVIASVMCGFGDEPPNKEDTGFEWVVAVFWPLALLVIVFYFICCGPQLIASAVRAYRKNRLENDKKVKEAMKSIKIRWDWPRRSQDIELRKSRTGGN